MEGQRIGPLSYSVEPPEGEPSAQRPILIGAAVIVALMFALMVAGWFVLGTVESAALVTNGAPVLILAAAAAIAIGLSRQSLRRTKRTALVVVMSLALLAAFFTNQMLGNVKAAIPQIRAAVDAIDLPPGFTMVTTEEFGDRLCRKGCPSVERTYTAPATDKDPVSTLILAMFDQGWQPNDPEIEPRFATVARRGALTAQLGPLEPHVVRLRVTRKS